MFHTVSALLSRTYWTDAVANMTPPTHGEKIEQFPYLNEFLLHPITTMTCILLEMQRHEKVAKECLNVSS